MMFRKVTPMRECVCVCYTCVSHKISTHLLQKVSLLGWLVGGILLLPSAQNHLRANPSRASGQTSHPLMLIGWRWGASQPLFWKLHFRPDVWMELMLSEKKRVMSRIKIFSLFCLGWKLMEKLLTIVHHCGKVTILLWRLKADQVHATLPLKISFFDVIGSRYRQHKHKHWPWCFQSRNVLIAIACIDPICHLQKFLALNQSQSSNLFQGSLQLRKHIFLKLGTFFNKM